MAIIALVEYFNKNGRPTVIGFSNDDALEAFTKRLSARKVYYLVTRM